jgi:addiction module RelB/DinJ family antitoxin
MRPNTKTVINIKADKKVKEKAQKIAGELGLPLGTIINAYLRQFVRNREVYFSTIPKMTPELEELIGQARKDFKAGKNISPTFSSTKEMDKYLDSL